jgi:hypothetical protein
MLLAVPPLQYLLLRFHAAEMEWWANYSGRLQTEQSGVQFPVRNISILQNVLTGSEVQPSIQWAPRVFVGGKGGRSVKLTNHLPQVHRLRISGTKYPVRRLRWSSGLRAGL